MRTFDCDRVGREDVVLSYLNNRISADEAEAFERHYFACDHCWSEVQRAIEIRAALQPAAFETRQVPVRMPTPRPVARRKPWPWIAAAATIVIATALWQVNRVPAPEAPASDDAPPSVASAPDVLRSPGEAGFRVNASRTPAGNVRLEWPVQPKATRYVVSVFADDGTPVVTRTVTAASLVLTREDLGRHATGSLVARVKAIDALDFTVASSARATIAARGPQER